MDQINLQTITGWSALVNTIAGIVSFAALMLFFMGGGLWGPLNDAFSVIWALALLPLAGWFFLLNRQSSLTLSAATAAIGIAAMLAFVALQFFLVVGLFRYEQTVRAVMALTGLIGLWMALNGLMVQALRFPPTGLSLLMIGAGVGLLLSAIGFILGGEQHPLAAAGYLVGFIAGIGWTAWLARLLLAGQVFVVQ